jgi:hypothetical protein
MARFVSPLEFHDDRGLNLVPQQNASHSSEQAKTINMKSDRYQTSKYKRIGASSRKKSLAFIGVQEGQRIGQHLHAPKGREQDQEPIMRRETRIVTRSKNSESTSKSGEENVNSKTMLIINRPYGSSLSPHAFLGKVQRRLPLTKINNDAIPNQERRLAKYRETCSVSHS